jgi:hypothetical protein
MHEHVPNEKALKVTVYKQQASYFQIRHGYGRGYVLWTNMKVNVNSIDNVMTGYRLDS